MENANPGSPATGLSETGRSLDFADRVTRIIFGMLNDPENAGRKDTVLRDRLSEAILTAASETGLETAPARITLRETSGNDPGRLADAGALGGRPDADREEAERCAGTLRRQLHVRPADSEPFTWIATAGDGRGWAAAVVQGIDGEQLHRALCRLLPLPPGREGDNRLTAEEELDCAIADGFDRALDIACARRTARAVGPEENPRAARTAVQEVCDARRAYREWM